ncbi:MAG TPA: membrane protein insertase YidC [Steroidobacteraceae bacterium]|nr:membrane protein insertase YidC [Steroidobacteraceae bacterium]
MTNNIRIFLWLALALAVYVNYTQWQIDYAPKPAPTAVTSTTLPDGTVVESKPTSIEDTVPLAEPSKTPPATADAVPQAAQSAAAAAAPVLETAGIVRVLTDVLVVDIDLKGGTLVRAELPGYPLIKGQPAPVVLFNRDSATTNYVMQSGLSGDKADERRPTHLETFTSTARQFKLADGQDEMRVPLTWTDGNGVTVTKTFVFHRSMFAVNLEYAIDNQSDAPWLAHSYARIMRTDPPVERSMFKVESFAFRGPAMWAVDKNLPDHENRYRRLKIDKAEDQVPVDVKDGWVAGMQHHFVSAIVPDRSKVYRYSLIVRDRLYVIGALGPPEVVAPKTQAVIKENLFVGPKLQRQLDTLHPELTRVADYGLLTPLSKPLFWLLDNIHALVKNWGLAIILATFLLKLMFYPLAQYSGRSMARMRALAPRMKGLQETYKDDRTKLGQATMELYKTEKVNPLSGCMPMLIQMPVFLAFYWVLLESVEMRQAPFMGWINDLSARDPFFILPALNGLAMWMQYKLNPPPPDPVQAKVFQFMPIVFSVMFALFPAGLVLYWVTNTGLSILQQWNINRTIEVEDKARKK